MKLPKHPFFSFLGNNEGVCIGDTVYAIDFSSLSYPRLKAPGGIVGLKEAGSVHAFEQAYYRQHKDIFAGHGLPTQHSVQNYASHPLVQFIVKEVLPWHFADPERGKQILRKLLGEDARREEKRHEQKQEQDKQDLSPAFSCSLHTALPHAFLFLQGKITPLMHAQHFVTPTGAFVLTGSSAYIPHGESGTLSDFEAHYEQQLAGALQEFFLSSKEHRERLKNETIDQKLQNIGTNPSYQEKDIGFLFHSDGKCYVYVQLDAYTMRNSSGDVFKFPPCKVGIELRYLNNHVKEERPLVFEQYSHPFLPVFDKPLQQICIHERNGLLNIISHLNGQGQQIHAYLVTAAQIMQTGYFGKGWIPHHYLTPENFSGFLIQRGPMKAILPGECYGAR